MQQYGLEGQLIAGKYRLVRLLGKGGMGSVWLAEHMTLHSPVAIKLIEPAIAQNPEALGRFLREAQAAASLRSPHVVQILDHGVDNGVPYIAMELLEGESLADRLGRVGRLSPADTARIMTQVARAVGRAHEASIVHRDLKPDNIYLVHNDDEELAKVLDFGIAKSTSQGLGSSVSSSTRTGAVLGTPYYMSPEQAEGMKSLDYRADLWALGVIAFECLLGRRPFDAETLGSLLLAICSRPMPVPSQVGVVPPGFDEWFARACSRDLGQRFASAKDQAAELRRLCEGGGLPAASPSAYGLPANTSVPALTGGGYPPSLSGLSATGSSGVFGSAPATPKPKSRALVVMLALLAAAGLAAGVIGIAAHKREAPTASLEPLASQSPAASSLAAAAPAVVPQLPSPPPAVEPAPAAVEPSSGAVPSASAPAEAHAAAPRMQRLVAGKPAAKAAPAAPPAAAAPPAPAAAPVAKKKVDLGI